MIRKKNELLITLLLLVGVIVLQIPASAGYWKVEYSSAGGFSDGRGSGDFYDFTYKNDPNDYYHWPLPCCLAEHWWVDPHVEWWETPARGCIDGVGTPASYEQSASVTASGVITLGVRYVPDDENDIPPPKVWIKYASAVAWHVLGESCTVSAQIDNPCEDRYYSYRVNDVNIPDIFPDCGGVFDDRLTDMGAYSYGVGYAELDVTSGFASKQLPLSLYVDVAMGSPVWYDWYRVYYQCYAYAYPLEEAPPLPLRKSGVPWRTSSPHCYFGSIVPVFRPRIGGTQSGGDPVDLATGAHLYLPDPDITCYNPYGPAALYQRNYLGLKAEDGYSSPGLSAGWVDNYDVKIVASFTTEGDLDQVNLIYPNSAQDTLYGGIVIGIASKTTISTQLKAEGDGGTITTLDWEDPIELPAPTGAPYFITSVPSQTPNRWDSITLTFKDQTQWVFTTEDGFTYYLSRIANRMGRYISIIRDANNGHRLSSVTDDSTPANELLSFHYSGSNLSYISDAHGRKVTYTFGSAAGTTCLLSVSQIAAVGTASPGPLEQYGYTLIQEHPHITTISTPSPTGSGLRTETINYDTSTLKVTSLVDANGNQCVFDYDGYNGKTKVQIKDPQDVVVKEWTELFDPSPFNGNIRKGTTDAKGRVATLSYEDWQNSGMPTTITDREGKATTITYDPFGNIQTTKDPRGTTTTYWYNYPDSEYLDDEYPDSEYPTDFRLGRLMKIQQGTKPPTTFTYYEPSGLIHTITTPKPGTSGGSETVTTTFTYDSLGNVLTKVVPGNPDNQTTTYNYTQDGTYTQSAKLGQPLTVTDNLGHVTHYRYDDRGNTIWTIDALGNRTDFTYNIADQLVTTINPSTSAP